MVRILTNVNDGPEPDVRLAAGLAIALALAACDEPRDNEWLYCLLCQTPETGDRVPHADDCPWVCARNLAEA